VFSTKEGSKGVLMSWQSVFCNFGKNELKICSSKMITDGKEYYQFKVNSITKHFSKAFTQRILMSG
jgi:hypothetical protein